MTKKSIFPPLFIPALLLPYTSLLIGFWFYQDGLLYIAPILIIPVITAVFSCFAVDNALYHMLISVNQIAAFILTTNILSRISEDANRLPAINKVVDPMSAKLSALFVIVGVLFIIGVFIIAYLYKKLSKMLLNYDERISKSESENAGSKSSLKVISVIAFIMIILSVLIVFAAFIFFVRYWDNLPNMSSQINLNLMIILFNLAVVLYVIAMVILRIVSNKDGAPLGIALTARAFGYTFLFTSLTSIIVLFSLVFILSGPVMFVA